MARVLAEKVFSLVLPLSIHLHECSLRSCEYACGENDLFSGLRK